MFLGLVLPVRAGGFTTDTLCEITPAPGHGVSDGGGRKLALNRSSVSGQFSMIWGCWYVHLAVTPIQVSLRDR